MKILVPIDGSSFSKNSVAFVASRTTLIGNDPEVELLVVLEPLPARASQLISKRAIINYYEDEAEKIFAPTRKIVESAGLTVSEHFTVGNPSEKIAEEANRMNADLIVMGSRGRTAMLGLILGSVTNAVLARTKQPLLIVRDKPVPRTDAMKVGVAVDGSPFSLCAVRFALRNKELFGPDSTVDLINVSAEATTAVMPDMSGLALPSMNNEELAQQQRQHFIKTTGPIRSLLIRAGISPRDACLAGNPGDAIADYAKKNKLDLIVLGSHGYGRFKSAVMGSTATRIAAQGNVPLLLVR